MAIFEYIAKENPEKKVAGTIEADCIGSAAQRLKLQGLFPVCIKPESFTKNMFLIFERLGLRKVGNNTMAQFTEQFANLLDAGIPLEQCLRLLERQSSNSLLKQTIVEVAELVCQGKPLAEALAVYPKIFSTTYISMVRVGEETGLLADMLRRLSKLLDEEYELRSRLKAAMVYPLFLSCVGLVTVIVVVLWVIPKFSSFFTSLEHQLPMSTRFVIELSSILAKSWPLIVAGLILLVLFCLRVIKNQKARFTFDKICLRMPVIGKLILRLQLAQFMRTLGILLSHGVNMLNALGIVSETLSNKFIASQVHHAREKVAKGMKLHECFSESRIFAATILSVMAVGQESGMLAEMFVRVSQQYDQQAQRQIKTLTNMMEPVMILVMGSVVGFVVIAMLMPIFKASALVH